eukprot:gene17803-23411_t
MGLLAQAFSFAIQEELHDYYRLLAVLEQELNRPLDIQLIIYPVERSHHVFMDSVDMEIQQ